MLEREARQSQILEDRRRGPLVRRHHCHRAKVGGSGRFEKLPASWRVPDALPQGGRAGVHAAQRFSESVGDAA